MDTRLLLRSGKVVLLLQMELELVKIKIKTVF